MVTVACSRRRRRRRAKTVGRDRRRRTAPDFYETLSVFMSETRRKDTSDMVETSFFRGNALPERHDRSWRSHTCWYYVSTNFKLLSLDLGNCPLHDERLDHNPRIRERGIWSIFALFCHLHCSSHIRGKTTWLASLKPLRDVRAAKKGRASPY